MRPGDAVTAVRTVVAAVSLVVLAAGCAAPERSCTLIAALGGVGVLVDAGVEAGRLELTVCPEGTTCRTSVVDLSPDADTVDQGCSGRQPDDVCSATAVPNGGRVGFVEWSELPVGPVVVSGRLFDGRRTTGLDAVTVTAVTSEPNGPGCDGQANQARVLVGSGGLRPA